MRYQNRLTRRELLRSAALSTSLGWLVSRAGAATTAADEALPLVRQITKGPRFHWFGYYDKLQFSADDRYILGNEVTFEHRSPKPDDEIRVGMVDTGEHDGWRELGATKAWNWQQGCMLQWMPNSSDEVIWNDREDDHFISRILNVKSGSQRTVPHPIYTLHPSGTRGIAPDFARLNDCRPGYGYAGCPDARKNVPAPNDRGIWNVDLQSGESKLLFTMQQAADIPYTGDPRFAFKKSTKHWFNHLLYNTDGTRFFFLHRWRLGTNGFGTRAFTANADGTNLYLLDPHGRTSHFVWRDSEHITAYSWHPSHGSGFYVYRDRTDEVVPIGRGVMTENGHNTYLPRYGDKWIVNDTYPDGDRLQHPYLYHILSDKKFPLGHFHSSAEYSGEWRCDTHPRSSRDGNFVCIDSPHEGGRQMFLIDVRPIVARGDA